MAKDLPLKYSVFTCSIVSFQEAFGVLEVNGQFPFPAEELTFSP